MRAPVTALAAALALATSAFTPAHADDDKPVPRVTLPAALARTLGEDVPDVVWIGLHPKRNDGVWVLLGDGWTLFAGLPADARAEVKAARKLPHRTPPVPLPDVGVTLHVVRFERD